MIFDGDFVVKLATFSSRSGCKAAPLCHSSITNIHVQVPSPRNHTIKKCLATLRHDGHSAAQQRGCAAGALKASNE